MGKLNYSIGVDASYDDRACAYAERFGIIDYEVKIPYMYYTQFFKEGAYRVEVDLNTMKEKSRRMIKRGETMNG